MEAQSGKRSFPLDPAGPKVTPELNHKRKAKVERTDQSKGKLCDGDASALSLH